MNKFNLPRRNIARERRRKLTERRKLAAAGSSSASRTTANKTISGKKHRKLVRKAARENRIGEQAWRDLEKQVWRDLEERCRRNNGSMDEMSRNESGLIHGVFLYGTLPLKHESTKDIGYIYHSYIYKSYILYKLKKFEIKNNF
ncbi:hypothetical protein Mapa_003692 [Marchantia paleacea]|nr:hypothetical protein Mapa_003692 [Marchantia paleacea]